jgi:hypothetical protein
VGRGRARLRTSASRYSSSRCGCPCCSGDPDEAHLSKKALISLVLFEAVVTTPRILERGARPSALGACPRFRPTRLAELPELRVCVIDAPEGFYRESHNPVASTKFLGWGNTKRRPPFCILVARAEPARGCDPAACAGAQCTDPERQKRIVAARARLELGEECRMANGEDYIGSVLTPRNAHGRPGVARCRSQVASAALGDRSWRSGR